MVLLAAVGMHVLVVAANNPGSGIAVMAWGTQVLHHHGCSHESDNFSSLNSCNHHICGMSLRDYLCCTTLSYER